MQRCPTCGDNFSDELAFCPRDSCVARTLVAADDDPVALLVGYTLAGRYRLDAVAGQGGFGAVYRATELGAGRVVAVKVLLQMRQADPELVARFRQEVQAAARIRHPNVVEVLDEGHDAAAGPFAVLPWLEGESLFARLRRGRLPFAGVDTVLRQTCGALEAAHALGIVHRDVKTENLFLERRPDAEAGFAVRLMDFGTARVRAPDGLRPNWQVETRPRQVIGSPASMSPEQVLGNAADPRSDLYSLGIVLFELLTGELPFRDPRPGQLMRMHVHEPPPPPSSRAPWLPAGVDDFVLALLAKRPTQRPQTAQAVAVGWLAVRDGLRAAWPT